MGDESLRMMEEARVIVEARYQRALKGLRAGRDRNGEYRSAAIELHTIDEGIAAHKKMLAAPKPGLLMPGERLLLKAAFFGVLTLVAILFAWPFVQMASVPLIVVLLVVRHRRGKAGKNLSRWQWVLLAGAVGAFIFWIGELILNAFA